MTKCIDCNSDFVVPVNTLSYARVSYCPKCYKRRLKKIASMPLNEFMRGCARQVLK